MNATVFFTRIIARHIDLVGAVSAVAVVTVGINNPVAGIALAVCLAVLFGALVHSSASVGYPFSLLLSEERQAKEEVAQNVNYHRSIDAVCLSVHDGLVDQGRIDVRLIDREVSGTELKIPADFGLAGWDVIDLDRLTRFVRARHPNVLESITIIDSGNADNTGIIVLHGKTGDATARTQSAPWD